MSRKSSESGQALVEAVVLLGVVGVLFVSIATGARLQEQWHQDLLRSHLLARSVVSGNHVSGDSTPKALAQAMRSGSVKSVLGKVLQRSIAEGTPAELVGTPPLSMVAENRALHPLLDGPMRWVHVRTRSKFANSAWHVRASASAAQSRETIDRIDQAQALWQRAARPSRQLVRKLSPYVIAVDAPWGRPLPSTDWLSKWSDTTDVIGADFFDGLKKAFNRLIEEFF